MSASLAQRRITRLVESGRRGSCSPATRISQLKKRVKELDAPAVLENERAFSALGDRTRLLIMRLLASEELCSCEVMAALDLTQPTASHHLGILERAGLIASRREGKWVFYKVSDPKIASLLDKWYARGGSL